MVGFLVRDYGELLVNSIIQHLPIADIMKVTDTEEKLKLPELIIPDRDVEGKRKNRKIKFTIDTPEADTKEELDKLEDKASFRVMRQEMDSDMSIYEVNPQLFRDMKYIVKVEPTFADKSTRLSRRVFLFDRLRQDPLVNQKELIRSFIKDAAPGEEETLLVDDQGSGTPTDDVLKALAEGSPGASGGGSTIQTQSLDQVTP